MASVTLYRDEAEEGDLPQLCICCGDPDAEFEERRFFWQPWWVNNSLWVGVFRRHASAYLPFCDRHAGGIGSRGSWFSKGPSLWGLRPTHITEDVLVLAGVSEEFADTLERHRDGERVAQPRRRNRWADETGDDRDDRPRPVARRPPRSSGSGALVVVLIVLGVVIGLPVLGCGGLMVLTLLLPRPAPPAFAPVQPVFPPVVQQPAIPAIPAGNLRPQDAVGVLAVAPAGCPAGVPWAAIALLGKPDLPRPPADAELTKALEELGANSPFTARDGAVKLSKMAAVEARRAEVAGALVRTAVSGHRLAREPACQALVHWGVPDNVPELLRALDAERSPQSRAALMNLLGNLKDPRAAEPLANRLGDFLDREPASKALVAIGRPAEEAVRPMLKHRDATARVKACEVLGVLGSVASAEDLAAAAKDPNPTVARAATAALDLVKDRP